MLCDYFTLMHLPIKWLHLTSCDMGDAEQAMKTGLIENFLSVEDNGKQSFNIVVSSYPLAKTLLESFAMLENAFQGLNVNFGWIDSEKKDSCLNTIIPDGKTIVIGEDKYINRWLLVPGVKTIHLSSIGRNNDQHIGFQRHFKRHNNPYSISLGELRVDISDAETIIRSAERLHFHIDVLRKEDSHSEHSHVSGLDIYQSCRLMRLAGLSKRLSLMCINTVDEQISSLTAESIAMLIWYYLEGQINKEIENMKQKENDIFLVNSDLYEEPVKFVVGNKTGRWWYQHPSTKEYVPCSEKDYQAISTGNLPDALVSLAN